MSLFDDNLVTVLPCYHEAMLWIEKATIKEINGWGRIGHGWWDDRELRINISKKWFVENGSQFVCCKKLRDLNVHDTTTHVSTFGGNIHISIKIVMTDWTEHALRLIIPTKGPNKYLSFYDNEPI